MELTYKEKDLVRSGLKVQAVKSVRNRLDLPLKEAKELVDGFIYEAKSLGSVLTALLNLKRTLRTKELQVLRQVIDANDGLLPEEQITKLIELLKTFEDVQDHVEQVYESLEI